jgi:hypothetical protein
LCSLSVSGVDRGGAGFLETMAQNAHLVELENVTLSDLNANDCRHLATWLSKTTSLQCLELENVVEAHTILASLRSNGTLLTVSIPGMKESRLARSYGLRNQHVGILLQSLAVDESDQVQNMANGKYRSKRERSSMSLYPTLLQCANQVSTTRTSTTLSTLMNLSDSIGI